MTCLVGGDRFARFEPFQKGDKVFFLGMSWFGKINYGTMSISEDTIMLELNPNKMIKSDYSRINPCHNANMLLVIR